MPGKENDDRAEGEFFLAVITAVAGVQQGILLALVSAIAA